MVANHVLNTAKMAALPWQPLSLMIILVGNAPMTYWRFGRISKEKSGWMDFKKSGRMTEVGMNPTRQSPH